MTEPLPISELSPLDQVRMAEAGVTRMVIAARENSERVIAEARAQASTLKKEARDSGVRQGQLHLRETVSQAEEDAKRIVEQASREAETLKQNGQARMEKAVREAINIVLGVQGGESK